MRGSSRYSSVDDGPLLSAPRRSAQLDSAALARADAHGGGDSEAYAAAAATMASAWTPKQPDRMGQRLLWAVAALNVVVFSLDVVFLTQVMDRMRGHEWAVTQVLYPWSTILFSWPILGVMHCTGNLPAHNWAFPKKRLIIIALCGTIGNYLAAFPTQFLRGSLRAVIQQLSTPILMVLSYFMLKTRYTAQHIIAACIIVVAGVLAVAPGLLKQSNGGDDDQRYSTGWMELLWVGVMLVKLSIPVNIFVERWSKDSDVNPLFMRASWAFFEVIIGLFLVPIVFLPVPGQMHVAPSQLPEFLLKAWQCFLGDASVSEPGADCTDAWAYWIAFLVMNVITDVTSVTIQKYGSAVFGGTLGAIQLPVSAALYSWPAVAGVAYENQLTGWTVAAVLVGAAGVALYAHSPEHSPQRQLSMASGSVGPDPRLGIVARGSRRRPGGGGGGGGTGGGHDGRSSYAYSGFSSGFSALEDDRDIFASDRAGQSHYPHRATASAAMPTTAEMASAGMYQVERGTPSAPM